MGREADATRTLLHPGETVAFLPWGNDFYPTYLAPNLDIKTFNIGGDKNLEAAVKKWPVSLLRFPFREQDRSISPDYGEKVEAILESGAAQAVALSYIDNFEPTQRWPVSPVFKDDLLRVADELDDNSRLTVENSENYSIIRLKPGLTPTGDPYLMALKKPLTMLPGQTLKIAGQSDLAPYFRERGWSALEATGVWSTSESSTLIVRAPEGIEHPLQLTVGFTPYAPRPENQTTVEILVNGKSVFSKNYVGPAAPVTEKMTMEPALFAQDRTATIEFKVTPLRSPTEFGANDPRKLGLMLHTIAIN